MDKYTQRAVSSLINALNAINEQRTELYNNLLKELDLDNIYYIELRKKINLFQNEFNKGERYDFSKEIEEIESLFEKAGVSLISPESEKIEPISYYREMKRVKEEINNLGVKKEVEKTKGFVGKILSFRKKEK